MPLQNEINHISCPVPSHWFSRKLAFGFVIYFSLDWEWRKSQPMFLLYFCPVRTFSILLFTCMQENRTHIHIASAYFHNSKLHLPAFTKVFSKRKRWNLLFRIHSALWMMACESQGVDLFPHPYLWSCMQWNGIILRRSWKKGKKRRISIFHADKTQNFEVESKNVLACVLFFKDIA